MTETVWPVVTKLFTVGSLQKKFASLFSDRQTDKQAMTI